MILKHFIMKFSLTLKGQKIDEKHFSFIFYLEQNSFD